MILINKKNEFVGVFSKNVFYSEKAYTKLASKEELTAWIDSQEGLREAAKIDDKDDFETIVEKINVYFDKDSISVNE